MPPAPMLHYPHATAPSAGTTIAVAPGIAWLRMGLPFALDHINLWLLDDGTDLVQIDTGIGNAETRAAWDNHFATTMARRPLTRVIATHYHPDHFGNVRFLVDRFESDFFTTNGEFARAHDVAAASVGHSSAAFAELFRRHGMVADDVAALAARGNLYRCNVPELPTTFRRLIEGDTIDINGVDWQVIIGYGHSPEHACLYSPALRVLVAGDMLLPRISTNISVWPVNDDGDPLKRFLASLDRFAALPEDTLVLPSHGLPFRGISLRVDQLHAHHRARLEELEQFCASTRTPVTAADALPVLFRRELDLQQRFFAMGEAIAHLNYLWHLNRLERRVTANGGVSFLP